MYVTWGKEWGREDMCIGYRGEGSWESRGRECMSTVWGWWRFECGNDGDLGWRECIAALFSRVEIMRGEHNFYGAWRGVEGR